ncbi:hypothetical protein PUNSTDRAFT_134994 [Punctularia strigosozonata HHB-11173 SS5]|uniref:uncharacterized protein n=1 Tax=Punctularia strigosozonata (strain HHB-11173) TaxID=741275 RepID=UPI00044168A5|nr:uncharacterized protein PUNSTDRAFT_134994 [Punctularia strigosozonata HHB-11173 SS5]EIN08617.1 hypothetical protein PUNSTDRAFT_134994 [Punctularia strigosozonata HHB-11173 SS5]
MFRFTEIGDIDDLNQALEWDLKAMETISPSDSNYSDVALEKISHLCTRHEVLQDMDDLHQAVKLSQDLLGTLPDGHLNRFDAVVHLAKALLMRGKHGEGTTVDIDEAIQVLNPAKDRVLDLDREPECLRILADCHISRFRITRDPEEAARALDTITKLLVVVSPGRHERFQCLIDAAEPYLEHGTPYRNLTTAFVHAQAALTENQKDVRSRIYSVYQGFFIQCESNTPMLSFDMVPGELRNQLLLLARQLERSSHPGQDAREAELDAARRRQQSEEFNSLLEEVRRLPGLHRSLLPDKYEALAEAADGGPVVVLVSSTLACHAVIIKRSGDVISIPLREAHRNLARGVWHHVAFGRGGC